MKTQTFRYHAIGLLWVIIAQTAEGWFSTVAMVFAMVNILFGLIHAFTED